MRLKSVSMWYLFWSAFTPALHPCNSGVPC